MADWHRVGQEIICVDTTWVNHHNILPCPIKGRIYTIDFVGCDQGDGHGVYFGLAEIQGTKFWYAWHFRPVKKKETDISVFKSLLTPTPKKKVLEDA